MHIFVIGVMPHNHFLVLRQRLLCRVNIGAMEVTIRIFSPQLNNIEAYYK